jgi:hypothetical protein
MPKKNATTNRAVTKAPLGSFELRRATRYESDLDDIAEVVETTIMPKIGEVEDPRGVIDDFEPLGLTPFYRHILDAIGDQNLGPVLGFPADGNNEEIVGKAHCRAATTDLDPHSFYSPIGRCDAPYFLSIRSAPAQNYGHDKQVDAH